MWIYEPDAPLANHTAPDAAERLLLPVPACDANTFENEAPQEAPGTVQPEVHATAPAAPVPARRGAAQAFPSSGMLAAAFLAGSAAAGVLYALCNAPQLEWLRAYLQSWLALFSASGTHAAAAIFAAEYITLLAAATCLFLLGFSAFGPVLIVLFMMLYGAGNGILTVQLFSGTSLGGKALLLLLTAVPASAAAACLCLLGAAALRVSGRIRAYSFRTVHPGAERPGAAVLFRQYLLTLVLFLPLCGAAAGLACLESRLF